jgi:hypothetical protein
MTHPEVNRLLGRQTIQTEHSQTRSEKDSTNNSLFLPILGEAGNPDPDRPHWQIP